MDLSVRLKARFRPSRVCLFRLALLCVMTLVPTVMERVIVRSMVLVLACSWGLPLLS